MIPYQSVVRIYIYIYIYIQEAHASPPTPLFSEKIEGVVQVEESGGVASQASDWMRFPINGFLGRARRGTVEHPELSKEDGAEGEKMGRLFMQNTITPKYTHALFTV